MTIRTRLVRAICDIMLPNGSCGCVDAPCCYEISLVFNAALAVLASPTDADVERVARAMWDVYVTSAIATEGAKGIRTWDRLTELGCAFEPSNAAQVTRDVGLAEARAAIRALVGEAR